MIPGQCYYGKFISSQVAKFLASFEEHLKSAENCHILGF